MSDGLCTTTITYMTKKTLVDYLRSIKRRLVLIFSETSAVRYEMKECAEVIASNAENIWIRNSVSYPNQETVISAIERIGDLKPEIIVAIGGGSAIDLAKILKAFYAKRSLVKEDINLIIAGRLYVDSGIEIIAVPTTAGTGSEVTQWATLWDENKEKKLSVDAKWLKPNYAFMVPELMVSADVQLSVATGLDSMSHAIEAYWAKKSNPLVRELAKQSLRISSKVLTEIIDNPTDVDLREKQCSASLLAGLAFSMTRTTACHSISYPLTMNYGIPHGVAVAMTLPYVMDYNEGHYVGDKDLMDLFVQYGGLKELINKICNKSHVSLKLVDYGVLKEDIDFIVEKSFTLGRMDNNATVIDQNIVRNILLTIYK